MVSWCVQRGYKKEHWKELGLKSSSFKLLIVQVHPKTERHHSLQLQANWEYPPNILLIKNQLMNIRIQLKNNVIIHRIIYQHLLTVVHHIPGENYNTPSSTRTNLPSRKNTLLNDMTDPFQSPCSSAYLVNNQNTPCTISSFSTYSSVNTENNNLPADLTTEAVEIEWNTNNPISKELLSEIDELNSRLNEQSLKNQKL